jgi:hypothetical protein
MPAGVAVDDMGQQMRVVSQPFRNLRMAHDIKGFGVG